MVDKPILGPPRKVAKLAHLDEKGIKDSTEARTVARDVAGMQSSLLCTASTIGRKDRRRLPVLQDRDGS